MAEITQEKRRYLEYLGVLRKRRWMNITRMQAFHCIWKIIGRTLNYNTLSSTPDDVSVRVYNSDFVKDNLSWLQNSDGIIQPLTLLGQINVEIEKQIQDIDSTLGNESENQGLFFELKEKEDKHNQQSISAQSKTKELAVKRLHIINQNTALPT